MPEGLTVNWQALTAIAAVIYTIFTAGSVILIYTQLKELIKNRIVQTSLALFDILQKPEARKSRKYIHDNLPVRVKGLAIEELEKHLEGMFEAVVGFDRIGYFLKRGYIHEDEIVPLFWAIVWRCWKKSEKLIRFTRRKRGDPIYRAGFEYFFTVCDAYREKYGYKKPRFY